jgi:hypothetical protein
MGQVTIYLDDEIETKMRLAAKAMKISQSKWISSLIKRKIDKEWPESIKSLAGAWHDFPTLSEIRAFQKEDSIREEL